MLSAVLPTALAHPVQSATCRGTRGYRRVFGPTWSATSGRETKLRSDIRRQGLQSPVVGIRARTEHVIPHEATCCEAEHCRQEQARTQLRVIASRAGLSLAKVTTSSVLWQAQGANRSQASWL